MVVVQSSIPSSQKGLQINKGQQTSQTGQKLVLIEKCKIYGTGAGKWHTKWQIIKCFLFIFITTIINGV